MKEKVKRMESSMDIKKKMNFLNVLPFVCLHLFAVKTYFVCTLCVGKAEEIIGRRDGKIADRQKRFSLMRRKNLENCYLGFLCQFFML